jgi:hypothetical protein
MQFSSQNNRFVCNRPDEPLKASAPGRPAVSRSFSVEERPDFRATPSGRKVNQYSTRSWISEVDTAWEVSASRLDDMTTRLDDV